MTTRAKVLIATVAALFVVGVAGMAIAQPSGGVLEDQRPVGPAGMMNGAAGAGGMMAGYPGMMGLDDEEMAAWMDQMHADPDRMAELHDEMVARYPQMQRHMDEFGMAPGRDGEVGAHCSGGASPDS